MEISKEEFEDYCRMKEQRATLFWFFSEMEPYFFNPHPGINRDYEVIFNLGMMCVFTRFLLGAKENEPV